MPTIKDALDIIGKLTVAEQESLKTMLLSPAFVKSLNIAVTITYNGNEMNKIALWGLPLSLLVLTAILVSFSAVSYFEAKYVQVRKVKRKFSGEDY